MFRVSDDGKFKRRAPQYSSQVDLQNARILSGAAKVSSKSPYKLEIAASSRLYETECLYGKKPCVDLSSSTKTIEHRLQFQAIWTTRRGSERRVLPRKRFRPGQVFLHQCSGGPGCERCERRCEPRSEAVLLGAG